MGKVFRAMAHHDSAGGILLIIAALIALVLANSPASGFYESVLAVPVVVGFGNFEIAKPLILWVNDGLMSVFFLLIGLEVKREFIEGHLNSADQIVLPGLAAVAGVAIPAIVYAVFNWGDELALRGWAIPSATDIAFALGILGLFGRSVPISLKLFLLSVAIFDDIAAILIIALFYSDDLSTLSLLVAGLGLAVLAVFNRMRVHHLTPYVIVGLVIWVAVLKSGVHATLAGFLVAWTIPISVNNKHGHPMLPSLEHELQPWVAFFILPFFAFANGGVVVLGISMDALFTPITIGIIAGLFVGKQLGIFGVCWLAIKTRVAKMPDHATWAQLYGVSLLAGIGFTMSLFIGTLAFEGADPILIAQVKLGVLVGSLLSAVVGAIVITKTAKKEVKHAA